MKEPRPDPVPPAMEWQTRNPSSDSEPEGGTAEAVPQARGMHPPRLRVPRRTCGRGARVRGCGAPPREPTAPRREAMAGATRERKMEGVLPHRVSPAQSTAQTRNPLPYTQERKPRPRIGTRGRCLQQGCHNGCGLRACAAPHEEGVRGWAASQVTHRPPRGRSSPGSPPGPSCQSCTLQPEIARGARPRTPHRQGAWADSMQPAPRRTGACASRVGDTATGRG